MFQPLEEYLRKHLGLTPGSLLGEELLKCKSAVVQHEQRLATESHRLMAANQELQDALNESMAEAERTRQDLHEQLETAAEQYQQMTAERDVRETKLSERVAELSTNASRRQQDASSNGSELTQLKHELSLAHSQIKVAEQMAASLELKLREAVAHEKATAAAGLAAKTRSSTEQMAAEGAAQRMSLECGRPIADLLRAKDGGRAASRSTSSSTPGRTDQAAEEPAAMHMRSASAPSQSTQRPAVDTTAELATSLPEAVATARESESQRERDDGPVRPQAGSRVPERTRPAAARAGQSQPDVGYAAVRGSGSSSSCASLVPRPSARASRLLPARR